jgi:tRNA nucleotidyltransferase (CCA-adding enzyme)
VIDICHIFDISHFPFDLHQLPQPAYIVGGWVRDRLLGRKADYLDLDFVLNGQVIETARKIAKQHQAGFVVLDADRQIARVVFKNATVDFAQQMGESLEADLRRRDYCMNAIAIDCYALLQLNLQHHKNRQAQIQARAIDPVCLDLTSASINNSEHTSATHPGDQSRSKNLGSNDTDDFKDGLALDPADLDQLKQVLIDPLAGRTDLAQKVIRMIAPENLIDDPLRILRAYRQAAQLDFTIAPSTRDCLVKLAAQPKQAGAQTSLGAIAAERIRAELVYLLSAPNSSDWLKAAVTDGVLRDWLPTQHLHLERLAKIDPVITQLCQTWTVLGAYFNQVLAGDRPCSIATKLAALTNSATALEPLGFSKAEQKFYVTLLRNLPTMMDTLSQSIAQIPNQQQYQIFETTGDTFPALIALAMANGADHSIAVPWLEQWLDPDDPIAHPVNLLTGKDLITSLNLPASPQIGELLTAIKLAQVEGIVQNYAGAIAYAKKLVIMKNSGQ